jgi:hypothetical protein
LALGQNTKLQNLVLRFKNILIGKFLPRKFRLPKEMAGAPTLGIDAPPGITRRCLTLADASKFKIVFGVGSTHLPRREALNCF